MWSEDELHRRLARNPDLKVLGELEDPAEATIQAMVVAWARDNEGKWPELRLLHAIPNGEWRHPATAVKLKEQGVLAGVPDLFLPVARAGYHGLYLELKTRKGRLSDAQRTFIDLVRQQGYRVVVARSDREAVKALVEYLNTA